ncbi:MAG: hypothetical protein Q4C83_02865 [Candidatus Saccharibacteria bacterium]|nr:hypothetical protein [Candidatus Saccharibacteria bacterium]
MSKAVVVKGALDDIIVWAQFNTNLVGSVYPNYKVHQRALLELLSRALDKNDDVLAVSINYDVNENGILQLIINFHTYNTLGTICAFLGKAFADICAMVKHLDSNGESLFRMATQNILRNEGLIANLREEFAEKAKTLDPLAPAPSWGCDCCDYFVDYYAKRVFSADNCHIVAFVPDKGMNSLLDEVSLTKVIDDNLFDSDQFDSKMRFCIVNYQPSQMLLCRTILRMQPLYIIETWLQRRVSFSVDLYATALVTQEYLDLIMNEQSKTGRRWYNAKLMYCDEVLRLEYQSNDFAPSFVDAFEEGRLLDHRNSLDKLINEVDVHIWEQARANAIEKTIVRLGRSGSVQLITRNPLGWSIDWYTTSNYVGGMLDLTGLMGHIQQANIVKTYDLLTSFERSNSEVALSALCIGTRKLDMDEAEHMAHILWDGGVNDEESSHSDK